MSKRLYIMIIVMAVIFAVALFLSNFAYSEGIYDEEFVDVPMYVVADELNLRTGPNKHSYAVAMAMDGDILHTAGEWSDNYRWIKVFHSEYGWLWCNYKYVTERTDEFYVETLWDTPIKIRNEAVTGRVTGYLRKGKQLKITQVVLGWGKSRQGWIDLSYCIEIGE